MKPLPTPPNQTRSLRLNSGFTLVELLTVIAIIAILTAIILPVFGLVRENTRRAASISNMQQTYAGLKQYELDNRRYPDFLYGPAIKANGSDCMTGTGANKNLLVMAGAGDTACSMEQVAQKGLSGGAYLMPDGMTKSSFYGALYPEYVKDLAVFHAPNNTIADVTTDTQIATVTTRLVPKTDIATNAKEAVSYYKYDSYDANQALKPDGSPDPATWKTRYTRQWVPIVDQKVDPTTFNSSPYKNQLLFVSPGTDTAISMDTYSAAKGKVIVLWLSGQAKVLDTAKLKNDSTLMGTNGNDFDYYKLGPNK